MKKLLFIFTLSLLMNTLFALAAGDIAIIAVQTDNPDQITFVTLNDIPANTTISFTDNAWNASTEAWRSGEGTCRWSNDVLTEASSIVTMYPDSLLATIGSITVSESNIDLASSGDQVLAYEGTTAPTANNDATWLYGFSTESFSWGNSSNTSDIPTALENYSVAMTTSATEVDNAVFTNGSEHQDNVSVSGTKTELLQLFNDSSKYYTSSSWITLPTYTIVVTEGGVSYAASPTFNPAGGSYYSFDTPFNVELSTETAGATIYYTIDGSDPDETSNVYTGAISITEDTTIKAIAYADGYLPSSVNTAVYDIVSPNSATLPYSQTFDSDFGDCYTYAVSGIKPWYYYSNSATANGYNGSFPEEHWLVLPKIDFTATTSERMTFNTYVRYGSIDAENYLKLFYSEDYPGVGDPTGYTWTEIAFTLPAGGIVGSTELSSPSGVLDLSGISVSAVYLAFKYYSNGNPSSWRVDDINIYEATAPTLIVDPASLGGFSYVLGNGPSQEQSFLITAADLEDDVVVTAPTSYEVSLTSGTGFTGSVSLTPNDGIVSETTIYTRLKAALAIGTYNEDISITSTNADSQTVNCDGEVSAPPAPEAPVASDASEIGNDSFTANWNAVTGATGYYLDVYTVSGTPASDLFFSEYIEGSSNNKALEIYNGTGLPVDLTEYVVKTFSGTNTTANYTLNLTGTLADGSVYIIANSSAAEEITSIADVTASVTFYNGDDAVGLYKNDVLIDVLGSIGSGTTYGGEVTLVRKADAVVPSATYSADDWDQYPQNTFSYLGSHTFNGLTKTYVTGFENLDISNVTSYQVTGLDPETTYQYVVRAYDAYSQSSVNSNEISVTTSAATPTYPEGDSIQVGENTITFTQGSANEGPVVEELPGWNNSNLDSESVTTLSFSLIGEGPWTISINTAAPYGAVYYEGGWHAFGNIGGVVTIEIPSLSGKGPDVIVILGDLDPSTLPIELSAFTVSLYNHDSAKVNWVTQSETGLNGFYILRNSSDQLDSANQISILIPATNTSQAQSYQYMDRELVTEGVYYYWLLVSNLDGSEAFYGPVEFTYTLGDQEGEVPEVEIITALDGVYPNPFNPSTNIAYSLSEACDVDFRIFNSRGQMIRYIKAGRKEVGNHSQVWDGNDANGNAVGSGIYYIRMQAGKESFNTKAVLLK